MNADRILQALGELDEKIIQETAQIRSVRKPTGKPWIRWAVPAACAAVILAAGIQILSQNHTHEFSLTRSEKVAVHSIDIQSLSSQGQSSSGMLAYYSEEELFSNFPTAIFQGTVQNLYNIEIDFNGNKSYRALAEIQVQEVYRGNCQAGDLATVLLPAPVAADMGTEDMDTLCQMETGTEGIFMPSIYDNASVIENNNATLYLKEIADYGFNDGIRWAFLKTDTGLVFDRNSYPGAKDASTLEDIRTYILHMLEAEHQGE